MKQVRWTIFFTALFVVALFTCTNNMTGVFEHYVYGSNLGDLIDVDGDGNSDGIDTDKDGVIDMVFVAPKGPPATGIDIDNDNVLDFYLISEGTGESKLNTKIDGSGVQVVYVYSGGRFIGFDINNDGVVDGSGSALSGTTYTISGSITGLTGNLVISIDSGVSRELMQISGGATYTGKIPVVKNSYYLVKIEQQPLTVTCKINNPSGIATANVTNANIVCDHNAVIAQGYGTSIDNNSDGIADGIDINGDGVIDMLFTTPAGPVTWGIDPGSGTTDFYMYISGSVILLNTVVDVAGVASGSPVTVIYNASNQFIGYDTNGDGYTDIDTSGNPVTRYQLTGTYHTNAGAPETTVLALTVNGTLAEYIPVNADTQAINSSMILLPGDVISLTVNNTTAYRCAVENGSGTVLASNWTGADVYCGTYGRTLDPVAFLAGPGGLLDSDSDGLIDAIDVDGNSTYNAGVDMALIPSAGIYGDGLTIKVDADNVIATPEFYLFIDGSGGIYLSSTMSGAGPYYSLKKDASNNPIGYDTNGDGYRDRSLSWVSIIRSDIQGSVSCVALSDPYLMVLSLTINGTNTYYLNVSVTACGVTPYSFATVLPAGGVEETDAYNVQIFNPNGAACSFTGASNTGIMPAVNVTGIDVFCN